MAFVTTTAILAGVFVNSLGVNTHIDSFAYGYQNLPVVENALIYLGVHNVRDSAGHSFDLQYWQQVATAAKVKFDDVMPEGSPTSMQATLALVPQFAAAGLLNFVEGGNEEDNADAIASGNSLAYTAYFQQQVYQVAHSVGLPAVNMSFGQGWTAANNWQGNYGSVGNLAAYADYANPHTYPAVANGQPNRTILWLNADAQLAAEGRPTFVSELGWNESASSQSIVATNLLNGIMDSARSGNRRTYIYALFDDQGGKFGVMNADGSPKLAGQALHNLTTLLGDAGTNATSFSPGALTYQLVGTVGGESSLVLQKSDGSYWVSVWDETSGTDSATLTLASAAQEIKVFDPLVGSSALQTASNATAVSFNLNDHPLLVEIIPSTASTASTTSTTIISSTANNSVLTGTATTTAIYAYGTGDTITGGSGTDLIQAFAGNNTINTGSGTAALHVGGAGNKITVGSGTTTIYDSGTNSSITFGKVGTPNTNIYGYALAQGNTLNFVPVLAGTQWDGAQATLGNFLKVTNAGTDTLISVNPSGLSGGVTYPVATLHGYAYVTLTTLLADSSI
ncbi:MAG: hypothetical protein EPO08_03385 [Rhodospirillaceae bacterium]|nr:MAG: hypothetical protein EPO08_03385 [Rhodospirillaceae bacterium]